MLMDPDKGETIGITLFEDDLRTGDPALNEMSPPGETMGRRVSVDSYEVAVDVRL
jgi:hypothetical protein